MAGKIRLDIITPEKIIYSQDVDMVIARAIDGDIGILPRHAPLITALQVWPLRIMNEGQESVISLCSGFMEVQPEKITVLASCAELPDEIDVDRAQKAKERAEIRLKSGEEINLIRAYTALKRAVMRLKVAKTAERHIGL